MDDIEEKEFQEIAEFIRKRAAMESSEALTADGELTREVAMLLHQRMLQGNGQIDDMTALLADIGNLKALYNVDGENANEPTPADQ